MTIKIQGRDMENKYQSELDEFHKNFDRFRGRKIVLYGIGRYTATLLAGVTDHNFVGLMDKDPANCGKVMFGLPVLTEKEAEQTGDMLIINTSGTYWNLIYQRIKGIKIPVYYLNGEPAKEEEVSCIDTDYWDSSPEDLYNKIEAVDIVSFDFFDTLFCRKVSNPRDVFFVLEQYICKKTGINIPYREIRSKAVQALPVDYSLDELYAEIENTSDIWQEIINAIKTKEIELEKELLTVRSTVYGWLEYAVKCGKEIFIISDMYLPRDFYKAVLNKYQINVREENILVSCEVKKNKMDGTLWKYFSECVAGKRRSLHIGDNLQADVEMPLKYNIETFYIAAPMDMLRMSVLGESESHILNLRNSYFMGAIVGKLFQDPFRLNKARGGVSIQEPSEMGYVVFGPVLLSFLSWVMRQSRKDGVNRLVFMSRDGYFLKEDYEYLCTLNNIESECCYLGISRQLVISASVQTQEDLYNYINIPYSGTAAELLEDRFGIEVLQTEKEADIQELCEKYQDNMWEYVRTVRSNYLSYLEKMHFDNDCAVVDLGFYGNNQRYLNELTGLNMKGYYFNADLSKENRNIEKSSMKACFQSVEDKRGKESKILEKMIFAESFLTAPYGMLKNIDARGNWNCAKEGGNQRNYVIKEKINMGVKQFIRDCSVDREYIPNETWKFADFWYGLCMSGKLDFSDDIKQSFYNDNALMNRFESMLFY